MPVADRGRSLDELKVYAHASPAGYAWAATKDDPQPYVPAAFHLKISESIVDVVEGRLDVLLLGIPVQHGKSELASKWTGAWHTGIHPEQLVTVVSYSSKFASDRIGGPARDIVTRHGKRFFDISVNQTSAARGRWNTTLGGGMVATGMGSGIAGRRTDLAIIDDPYGTLEEAMSKNHRDWAWDWYQYEFATRFAPNAGQIHIMSRWNEDDHFARMIKHCEENGLRYRVIDFPALAICPKCGDYGIDKVNQCGHGLRDELGRLPGEALWPEMRDRAFLLKQRKLVGVRAFDALFQGRPRPDGGLMFGAEWFRYYDIMGDRIVMYGDRTHAVPINACRKFQFVDPATSTDPNAARFRIGTFLMTPSKELIIWDMAGGTLGAPRAKALVKAKFLEHHPREIGMEQNGLGLTFVQDLMADSLPIKGIVADRDKVSRASVATILYENLRIYHPKPTSPWKVEMEAELLAFPAGKFKDIVDVISMAAIAVSQSGAMAAPSGHRLG